MGAWRPEEDYNKLIMVQVIRKDNESIGAMLRRFSKRVQLSRAVARVRSRRFSAPLGSSRSSIQICSNLQYLCLESLCSAKLLKQLLLPGLLGPGVFVR